MNAASTNIFSLVGKDIWIFGGAGHRGQRQFLSCPSAGTRILCVDLQNRAEDFVSAARLEANVTQATADVRDVPAVKQLVAGLIQQRGVPHGLVNLTFASIVKRLEGITEKEFDEVNHGGLRASFPSHAKLRRNGEAESRQQRFTFQHACSVSRHPKVYEANEQEN